VLICGVDEAGRGSMLGPLVVAGVSLQRSKIKKLSSMGVRDSKRLTPQARKRLYKKIIEYADNYYVARIHPKAIDRSVNKHQLNLLEAKYMAKVIAKLEPNVSYVDSCDVDPVRYGKEINRMAKTGKVRSYHHADSRFIIVSAASILAKVNRDRAIAKLQKEHDLGSGYPSDSKTVNFVANYISEKKTIPSFVRKSWKPVQKMIK